ncbi:ORC1-type DNA replication protein [Candidatus Woesearchaeota archaeon]|nr:ORC1-type DNA replication protein [Candidatus Woesearchaeota archaeon]
MKSNSLTPFFESFLKKDSLFLDKTVLQSVYTPDTILHRDDQIKVVANILAPALRLDKPSNLFIYGKTGTGKTLTIKFVSSQMEEMARSQGIPLHIRYLNCKLKKIADTEYRLVAQLARELGKAIPPTGLPTDEVYKIFFDAVDTERKLVILILDEIDQLVTKAGDEILYNLTRINSELKQSQISLIGISNSLVFTDHLDPRIKSSLSEEEVVFPPYNALQIQNILKRRARLAFKEGVLSEGVIEKCAAYAAREHGDARRALELLRVAGEVAERNQREIVMIADIDEAEDKIERDRIIDIVRTQPKQYQLTLAAILSSHQHTKDSMVTGDVYDTYRRLCIKAGLRPLTQRRVSDIIAEFDMLGLINTKVVSKGRYGRTREIVFSIPGEIIPRVRAILDENYVP